MMADESVEAERAKWLRRRSRNCAASWMRWRRRYCVRWCHRPTDSRNSVMEIRGGTGGDEANIFAGDLYRMYCRYAETAGGWK